MDSKDFSNTDLHLQPHHAPASPRVSYNLVNYMFGPHDWIKICHLHAKCVHGCAYSCVYIAVRAQVSACVCVFCVYVCIHSSECAPAFKCPPDGTCLSCICTCVLSPEAGRPDAALHPWGEHIQPLVCAVGPGRGHTLQRPGEAHVHTHTHKFCSIPTAASVLPVWGHYWSYLSTLSNWP